MSERFYQSTGSDREDVAHLPRLASAATGGVSPDSNMASITRLCVSSNAALTSTSSQYKDGLPLTVSTYSWSSGNEQTC